MSRSVRSVVLVSLAAVALVGSLPSATALSTSWMRRAGKALEAVAVAPDGSVYAVGGRRQSITVAASLYRYTPGGARVWRRSWVPDPHASTKGEVIDVAEDGTIVWGGQLRGQCEGSGWFLEWRSPTGRLLHRYTTPGWACRLAEGIVDISARHGQVVVVGRSYGCCSDPFEDGWVRAFGMDGQPRWRVDIEPPAGTPSDWFDSATGVAAGGLGNLYVAGWAANVRIRSDADPRLGTPILVKLSRGGAVLWSRRLPAVVRTYGARISVAARADRVVVTAPVGGRTLVRWGAPATAGWLAALDTGGSLQWQTRWDDQGRQGASPTHVAIDAAGVAWVVGTRRDVAHRELELFVRRFGHSGGPLGGFRAGGPLSMRGTGLALIHGGAVVSGARGTDWYSSHGGRLWRLAA